MPGAEGQAGEPRLCFALINVICLVGMSADVSRLNRHFLVPLILPLLTQYPEDMIELYLSQPSEGEGGLAHSTVPLAITLPGV